MTTTKTTITLRALEPEDADMMYRAEADEAAWLYSDYLAPLSREMLRQYALTYDADPLRSGQLRLIVEADGSPAGILDFFDISPRHLRADTGLYLLPEFRHKGFGVRTLGLAKEFAGRRLGLHQLTATVAESNHDAFRCFSSAGFTPSGSRPDWLRTPGGYEAVFLLSAVIP